LAEVGDSILLLIPQFPKLLDRGWAVPGVMIIAESKYFPNLLGELNPSSDRCVLFLRRE
jgi:hypothetical protein